MATASQQELSAFMAAIRKQESGGNYTIQGPNTRYGRATGAYQFLRSTWNNYGGYRDAKDAPPAVQDARAASLMTQYFSRYGSWELVAVAWHAGPGKANQAMARGLESLGGLSDGISTTVNYARRAVSQMDSNLQDAGFSPEAARAGLDPYNPNAEGQAEAAGGSVAGAISNIANSGSVERDAGDPLGFSSGGPGTVVAPSSTAPAISFGDGELDLSDTEKVSAEVDVKYGDLSDEEFLTEIYDDVLGRDPDKSGFDFWLGQLASGTSRADIFRGFYASPEGGEQEAPLLSEVELMVRQRYPDWAWALDNDEVRDILLEATDPTRGLDDATFMSRIRDTDWWKNTEATQREWDARSAMDPATAQREIEKVATELRRRATTLGADISDEALNSLAEKVMRFGLTEAEINDSLAANFDANDPRGDVAANLRQARAQAKAYMVNVPDDELVQWAQQVAVGQASPEDLHERIMGLARAKFGQDEHLTSLIDAGVAPSTYFTDHQQLIANELDMSASQVDLMDPKYSRILSSALDGSVRPMDLDETRKHIRETSEFGWAESSNGRAKIADTTQSILQLFGKVA